MKLVLIEWDDACASDIWEPKDNPTHIRPAVTVGVLTREDDKEIEVSLSMTCVHKSNVIAIPKGCMKRMRKLHL